MNQPIGPAVGDAAMPASTGTDLNVAQLVFPEQFLVWALRQWVGNPGNRPLIKVEAVRLFHTEHRAQAAITAFDSLLRRLARQSRRTLYFYPLNCRRVSADEVALLTLVGALQAGRRDHAEALSAWLVPRGAMPGLLRDGETVAVAMREVERLVPRRCLPPPPARRSQPPVPIGSARAECRAPARQE